MSCIALCRYFALFQPDSASWHAMHYSIKLVGLLCLGHSTSCTLLAVLLVLLGCFEDHLRHWAWLLYLSSSAVAAKPTYKYLAQKKVFMNPLCAGFVFCITRSGVGAECICALEECSDILLKSIVLVRRNAGLTRVLIFAGLKFQMSMAEAEALGKSHTKLALQQLRAHLEEHPAALDGMLDRLREGGKKDEAQLVSRFVHGKYPGVPYTTVLDSEEVGEKSDGMWGWFLPAFMVCVGAVLFAAGVAGVMVVQHETEPGGRNL